MLIWAVGGDLGEASRRELASADAVLVSAASIWEIEIKRARGRLTAPPNMVEQACVAGFDPLPITMEHASQAGRLPLHHRDPFDRMLVAQARAEGLTLVTADATLSAYGIETFAASRA